jgi:hypothetical protein
MLVALQNRILELPQVRSFIRSTSYYPIGGEDYVKQVRNGLLCILFYCFILFCFFYFVDRLEYIISNYDTHVFSFLSFYQLYNLLYFKFFS